jgi:hypothetical protein
VRRGFSERRAEHGLTHGAEATVDLETRTIDVRVWIDAMQNTEAKLRIGQHVEVGASADVPATA